MVCCPCTSGGDRTYGTKTGVYLLALRISQFLFFPCYLLPGQPGNSRVLYASST